MKSGLTIDPTDILAIVLMAIFSMRRMDIRATDRRAFPSVATDAFEAWKESALAARAIAINTCFAKFALNSIWFYGFRNRVAPRALVTGGLLLFTLWVVGLLFAWWRFSKTKTEANRLGIVIGRRIVEEPAGATAPQKDDSEASSR